MAQRGSKDYEDYEGFVEKFKPKKTTDDCYTPPGIYEVIRDWACDRYGINPGSIVRPFFPGGNYQNYDYPEDCVVLDNPPFSIISEIVTYYLNHEIDFFLFAPALTMFGGPSTMRCNHIAADASIVYENGAKVPTNFVTSFGDTIVETAPDLHQIIKREIERGNTNKSLPKYIYPNEILTAAACNKYAKYGIDFKIYPRDCMPISKLEHQAQHGKAIFGKGLLLSERAAAERAAANVWHLSEAEKELSESLGL